MFHFLTLQPPPQELIDGLRALVPPEPAPLLFLARDAVRRSLELSSQERVASLPLPARLQNYVLLRTEFP